MDNNEKKNGIPDFLKDILETDKKHEDTPSEKIVTLALERDLIYDKINSKKKELEALDSETCDDALFLKAQITNLKEQKDMLGSRIKRLVDET